MSFDSLDGTEKSSKLLSKKSVLVKKRKWADSDFLAGINDVERAMQSCYFQTAENKKDWLSLSCGMQGKSWCFSRVQ